MTITMPGRAYDPLHAAFRPRGKGASLEGRFPVMSARREGGGRFTDSLRGWTAQN
jgi:hypothetical protein